MNIRVFQAGKGRLPAAHRRPTARESSSTGACGRTTECTSLPHSRRLREQGLDLDLVYVSHIDRDHISGVLQLMDDLVAWRVFDYQRGAGNLDYPEPPSSPPAGDQELWHNAFHELVSANRGDIERPARRERQPARDRRRSRATRCRAEQRELATSIAEGIELSRQRKPRAARHPGQPPVRRQTGARSRRSEAS